MLEIVDADDQPEKEIDDGKLGKKVEHKRGHDQLEPSPVIRSRHSPIDDTEVGLQQLTTEEVTHKVLENQSETDESESVLDSQVLNYDEYSVDAVQDASYVAGEAQEYEQYDAQSLGAGSDAEQFDEDGYEPETSELTEDQLEVQRDNSSGKRSVLTQRNGGIKNPHIYVGVLPSPPPHPSRSASFQVRGGGRG